MADGKHVGWIFWERKHLHMYTRGKRYPRDVEAAFFRGAVGKACLIREREKERQLPLLFGMELFWLFSRQMSIGSIAKLVDGGLNILPAGGQGDAEEAIPLLFPEHDAGVGPYLGVVGDEIRKSIPP